MLLFKIKNSPWSIVIVGSGVLKSGTWTFIVVFDDWGGLVTGNSYISLTDINLFFRAFTYAEFTKGKFAVSFKGNSIFSLAKILTDELSFSLRMKRRRKFDETKCLIVYLTDGHKISLTLYYKTRFLGRTCQFQKLLQGKDDY